MERYTEKHYDGNGYYLICSGNCETLNCGDCGILDKIVDRLAAYEGTGLEPEEILSAVDMAKIACALHELNAYKELGSIDRLCELKQADDEGRCVVFQPGYAVVSIYNPADEDGLYTMKVTGVITKEKYEAALRREQE